MKPLTTREKQVYALYRDSNRRQIADELGISMDYVTAIASNIRKKGYELKNKRTNDDDSVAILDAVTSIQNRFNQVGESEAFKEEVRLTYIGLGFKSMHSFTNRVRSYMGKNLVDGCYSDYIRGKVSGHRYVGTMPNTLVMQKWDGGLVL